MLRVLEAAAAAMAAEQVRVDLLAHNLANADTEGFRRLLITVAAGPLESLYRRDGGAHVGLVRAGPGGPQAAVDLRPGVLVPTADPRDLAVEGRGFVLLEGGRLTGCGRLGVDGEGFLTLRGLRVLGAAGPIRVGEGRFHVRPDGTVDVSGRVAGRIRVVEVQGSGVALAGSGVYAAPPEAVKDVRAVLRLGFRQRPEVNPVQDLVQLMVGFRTYEAAARCVQIADEVTSRRAEVARL